jgi:hypothetical protein
MTERHILDWRMFLTSFNSPESKGFIPNAVVIDDERIALTFPSLQSILPTPKLSQTTHGICLNRLRSMSISVGHGMKSSS